MKKVYLLLLLCCAAIAGKAQTAATYVFSQSMGTYTNLTSPTQIFSGDPSTGWDDNNLNGLSLPFSFVYLGTPYTSINVNANGWINFSGTITSSYVALTNRTRVISGFNNDLIRIGSDISYQVTGSAPNRVFTVQWQDFCHYNLGIDANNGHLNFQIQLYETSNIIKVVYGPMTPSTDPPSGKETMGVGINGATSTDFNVRTTTSDWTNTTAGTTNAATCTQNLTIKPPTGLTFQWAPPLPCVAPTAQPTALTFTPGVTSIGGSFTAASPAADNYLVIRTTSSTAPSSPVNGTTYTVGSAALGGTIVSAGNLTSFTATGLTPSTPYWFWVYSYNSLCTGGPMYMTATPLSSTTTTGVCSISGTKTVGATGDYTTLTAAMTALNNNGVTGSVILELQSNYNSSGETFPIVIGAIPCAGPTNTLTIRPAAGVAATINGSSSATAVFKFLNAQYVTIDGINTGGRSLTINNNNTGASATIWLASTSGTGGNNFVTVKNTTIVGGTSAGTTSSWAFLSSVDGATANTTSGPNNDNITIQNNIVTKAAYGIYAFGTAAVSAGGLDNWIVTGNTFGPSTYNTTTNIGYNGMYLGSMINPTISNNTIQNVGTTSLTSQTVGIGLNSNITGATVDHNIVNNINAASSSSGASAVGGIILGSSVINSNITRNTVSNVYNYNTSGYSAKGIIISTGSATSNVTVANNMIYNIYATSDAGTQYWNAGIDLEGTTGGVNIYYNTVNMAGTFVGYTSATGSAAMLILTSGTNLDIRDNIFVNTYNNTNTSTDKGYAIYSTAANTSFSNIDYNEYYATSPDVLGYIGSDRVDLAGIQAGFGSNTHSLNIVPTFVSATDLHLIPVASNLPLRAGIAIAGTVTDIDGTNRSASVPVMGAHEANLSALPPVISFTTLQNTCNTGDVTLTATISDAFSGVPTSGSLVPRVYYRKGTGAWSSKPGTLISGNGTSGTWSFTIASIDMGGLTAGNIVSYYVIAQTNAGYVGTNPYYSGLVASNVNTVTTPPASPFTYLIQPLFGTLNVGVGQTYTTITDAIAAYNANTCLTGPIVLNLTDATYPNETFPIVINNNTFASASATLTIKPAAGVAVTINGNSSASCIFKLLNARYVTIDGVNSGGSSLTLNNPNTAASTNIWLASTATTGVGCKNITLTNLNIVGGSNIISTDYGIIAAVDATTPSNNSSGGDNDNITISNNTFSKVGYAVFTSGSGASSTGANDNWVITGNTVSPAVYSASTNAGVNGMFFRNMVNLLVSGNTIQNVGISTSNAFGTAGLYFESNVNRAVVSNNSLINITTGSTSNTFGIYFGGTIINSIITGNTITGCHNDASGGGTMRAIYLNTGVAISNDTVVNNMVSDIYGYGSTTASSCAIGIGLEGATGTLSIWHNSVYFSGSHVGNTGATNSFAFYTISSGTNIDLRNNIFVNTYDNSSSSTDVNYAVYSTTAATGFSFSDFNDYYVSGGVNKLAKLGGTDVTTLAGIQTASGGNLHSVNVNPNFTSNNNLHIPTGTASQLESGGTNVGVTTDIDGQVRPGPAGSVNGGASAVDIGADEFDGIKVDVIAPAISYTALANSCGTGDRTLTASITDATGVNTTATLKPRIYYKKSTASTWQSQAGTLSSGTATNGSWSFSILAADMGGLAVGDVVQYYVIAQDVASTPNIGATPGIGLVATDVNNPSTPPTTPNTYSVIPSLGGNYNVGAGQPYTTLTAAINAYNNACLTGPVTFTLMDATYGGETYPITINANIFASATNTLTVKPASGVSASFTGSSSSALIVLNGADYVIIDGTNSSINNSVCPNVSATRNITFTNTNTGTSSALIWLQTTSGNNAATNNTIKNCNVVGSGNTQTLIGIGSGGTSIGSSSLGNGNNNNRFENNNISAVQIGVYSMGNSAATKNQNTVINQNVMNASVSPNMIRNDGILTGFENNITISGNIIANIANNASRDYIGISVGIADNGIAATTTSGNEVTNATVTNNTLNNFSKTDSWGGAGIAVYGGSTGTNTIANNVLSQIGARPTASDILAGIFVLGNGGGITNIYNNSVTIGNAASSGGGSYPTVALAVLGNNPIINIKNNILAVTVANASTILPAIALGYSTFTNLTSDYNDFYTVGTYLGGTGAMPPSTTQATLAAWQTITGQDAHSKNINPVFAGASDLHIASVAANVPLMDAGTPVPVTNDIDCSPRSGTTPDIGADEFNIPSCNSITPGVATAVNPVLCVSGVTTVNVTSATAALGMSYQWQSSPDSLSWTVIPGATNTSYIIPSAITATQFYRMVSTCSFSGLKDSTTAKVRVTPLPNITVSPDGGAYCSGSSLTMGASGAVSYTWAPSAGLSATTGAAVSTNIGSTTSYTVTGTDVNGCVNTHVSTIAVTATPLIPTITPATVPALCNGGSVMLTASTPPPGTVNGSSGSISVTIPDVSTTGASNTININSIPAGAIISSMSVNFNMTMTYVGDLNINLTAPNGNTLNLVNREGLGGDNFVNTTVSSLGTTTFGSASAPYTGTFAPDAATGDIGAAGYPVNVTTFPSLFSIPNGSWVFSARDHATGDIASLTSWSITINYTLPPATFSWSPAIGLFTDAALTTPYSGGTMATVYAAPTASSATTNNTYTAIATNGACTATRNITVTVNPNPGLNTGNHGVCQGSTTTLNNTVTGGTWSTSSPNLSIANPSVGTITGVNVGTGTVTYMLGTGCMRVSTLTVNPLPAAISGNADVCIGATNALNDATPGGTWSSSATGTATIGSTGALTGVVAGYSTISYTLLTTGCSSTVVATVNVLPVVTVTPSTNATVCMGGSTTFTAATSVVGVNLLSQNFNSGLGSWTLTNGPAGDASTFWQIVSVGANSSTGDGSQMLQSFASASGGVSNSIVTSPSFSTLGYASATLTFNQTLLSDVPDVMAAVEYSVNNGPWTMLPGGDFLNTFVNSGGTWNASSPETTISLPSDAIGQGNVKLRWHYDGAAYWWLIDNINVTAVPPAATYMWTGADGLSCVACGTTTITPSALGLNSYSVTATTSHNCMTTTPITVSVNAMPSAIGGTPIVCEQSGTQLSNEVAGGTWTSDNSSVAMVNSAGLVSGITAGTATIVNTQVGGCNTSVVVTVNTTPAPITGVKLVCTGYTTDLGETTTGGTWNSTVNSTASVNSTGTVLGNFPGTVSIDYIMTATGCKATAVVTVNQTPAAISGPTQVCESSTITLGNTLAGGTWSSSNTNALVDMTSGVVTGNNNGTATITYQMSTGCLNTTNINVNVTPAPIMGSPLVCEQYTTALSDPTSIGVWTSSNTTNATVNGLGVVSGIAAGTSTITYTMLDGCYATRDVTVNMTPAPITGTLTVCEGLTTELSSTTNDGNWSTGVSAIATVDATNGTVTGGSAGVTTVSYTLGTGCYAMNYVTVYPTPAAITGANTVCEGATTTLNSVTNGGTWSSSATANATITSTGGVVSGILAGNTTITYMLPQGCTATKDMTVNPTPTAITTSGGIFTVCEGAALNVASTPAGGTWSSMNTTSATVNAGGSVSGIQAGNSDIVYTLPEGCTATQNVTVNPSPSAITGTNEVCEGATTTLANTVSGGAWSSSNTTSATVGSTGVVSGQSAGLSTISYMLPAGCYSTTNVNVYQTPAPITTTGAFQICEGDEVQYVSTPAGGTWSSSNTSIALINASGLLGGITHGTATIEYTLAHGCSIAAIVTVNTTAAPVTGTAAVCEGNTTTLGDTVPGGTWSSSNTAVATVDAATGEVTGHTAGNTSIVYNMPGPAHCSMAATVTVNPTPTTIGGSLSICKTASTTLSNTVTGGTWMSTMPAVATVNATSGLLTGVDAGTATVSYATAAGCSTSSVVTVNVTVPAITVSQNVTGVICNGTTVTFTANPVNGGTTPTYTWHVNSTTPSTTGNTYTYTPANGDVVKAVLHSNATCALPDSAVSTQTMNITPNVMPTITVNATPGNKVCKNTPVTFNSSVSNGGSSPLLTWVVNGVSVSNADSYTYTPNNNDIVYCVLNSNAACVLDTEVYSNNEDMAVDSGLIPIVNITPLNGTSIVKGQVDSFQAVVLNGGNFPRYQWFLNGVAISGQTNSTFGANINGGLNGNRDSITVQVTADGPCALSTFNSVVVKVIPLGVAPVPVAQSDLRLIPNPNSGEFVVSGTLGTTTDEEVALEITDMLGQIVYKGRTISKGGAISERIKLSNALANGMYMLNVRTGNANDVFHFVLKQ